MTQPPAAQSRYLDARVTTASQPELQLMLLDGALRFGRQAEQLWTAAEQREERDRLLARTLDIVEELIHGVAGGKTEQSKRLEEEYAFAFRQLALAQLNRAAAPLAAALKILDFHRETWKLACEKLRSEAPAAVLNSPAILAGGESLSLTG
jgi:flagellar secretion chaperone FliS